MSTLRRLILTRRSPFPLLRSPVFAAKPSLRRTFSACATVRHDKETEDDKFSRCLCLDMDDCTADPEKIVQGEEGRLVIERALGPIALEHRSTEELQSKAQSIIERVKAIDGPKMTFRDDRNGVIKKKRWISEWMFDFPSGIPKVDVHLFDYETGMRFRVGRFEGNWACILCKDPKVFESSRDLSQHIKMKHEKMDHSWCTRITEDENDQHIELDLRFRKDKSPP